MDEPVVVEEACSEAACPYFPWASYPPELLDLASFVHPRVPYFGLRWDPTWASCSCYPRTAAGVVVLADLPVVSKK